MATSSVSKILLLAGMAFSISVAAETQPKFKVNDDIPKAIETLDSESPDNPKFVSTHYKDLDEDGVPDAQDQCLNTGRGYKVDAFGCELDSDKDGVYDRFDQCPETPLGTNVNFLGCEPDTDKDKVLDSKDQCPGTPLGTIVDEVGCDNDHDKDGVINPEDRCPNTPEEHRHEVNIYGCHPMPLVITNIVFDTGSYEIRADQRPILEKDLSRLDQLMPDEILLITGHTDDVGTAYRNLKLSWNRAQSTKDFFTKDFDVSEEQVYVLGKGESDPAASNLTPEDRQTNRRIELEIISKDDIPNEAKQIIPDAMKGYQRWAFRKPTTDKSADTEADTEANKIPLEQPPSQLIQEVP